MPDSFRYAAQDGLIVSRNFDRGAPSRVVVVDVNEDTVANQGRKLPLDRRVYAEAIDRLNQSGVRAIAVDVQFTEPSSEASDVALVDAIDRSKVPVVLATDEVLLDGDTNVLGGRQTLRRIGATAAHAGVDSEGGKVRTVRADISGIPSFAQAVAEAVGLPGLLQSIAAIDPTVPGDKLSWMSMQDLIGERKLGPSALTGRVAVIGVSVTSSTGADRHGIAGSANPIPGVAIQAQAIDTALRGAPLRAAGWYPAFVLAVCAGLLAMLGGSRRTWIQSLWFGVSLAFVATFVVVSSRLGILLDPGPAFATAVVSAAAALAVRADRERRKRWAAKQTLRRFLPDEIVEQLLADDNEGSIAQREQIASVLFCDLRGYTRLVAELPNLHGLIQILDVYLTEVTKVIHRHGGAVVSFQGDGVMAVFGVPIESEKSASNAISAGCAVQREALPAIRKQLQGLFDTEELAIGIGIASGPVLAGTVGPPERREYAAVGPTTNLAARLQAMTKIERVSTIIDEATATSATSALDVALKPLGVRDVRGLQAKQSLWTADGDWA